MEVYGGESRWLGCSALLVDQWGAIERDVGDWHWDSWGNSSSSERTQSCPSGLKRLKPFPLYTPNKSWQMPHLRYRTQRPHNTHPIHLLCTVADDPISPHKLGKGRCGPCCCTIQHLSAPECFIVSTFFQLQDWDLQAAINRLFPAGAV